MTQVETKVFDTESLGRRMIRKKVWGKIPALPLVALLVVASLAAAAIFALGPSSSQSVTLGSMTSTGLPTGDILFGQVGAVFYFNITISANTYTQSHTASVVLTVSNAALTSVAACTGALTVQDDTVPHSTYATLTPTQSGTTCTYTGGVAQAVAGGSTVGNWPFSVKYLTTPSGAFVWTSQFTGT